MMRLGDSDGELQALLKFLYMAPVGVVQATPDGQITIINPMAANLLMPLQADGTLTNIFTALGHIAPELQELAKHHSAPSGLICKSLRLNPFYRARRRTEQRTYELTLLKVDVGTLMAVLTDVTDIVKREEQIRLGAAWYNGLLNERLNYGVIDLDEDGVVLTWNAEIEKLTGFSEGQIVGQSCELLYAKDSNFLKRLPDLLYEAGQSGWTLQNDWCVTASGKKFWSNYIISASQPLSLDAEEDAVGSDASIMKRAGFVLLLRDIDDHVDTISQMLHAGRSDHLTGMMNRRAFFDLAEIEIRRWARVPRSLCLLIIDADFFKKVNDKFGHTVGDTVLRSLGAAITTSVREIDLAARIGGEEFAVLLPYTELKDARDLAQRVCTAVENLAITIDGHTIKLTVSIGVAQMSTGIKNLESLIKLADSALYSAKNLGRNRVESAIIIPASNGSPIA